MKDPTASSRCQPSRSRQRTPCRWVAIVSLSLTVLALSAHAADELDSALGALQRLDYEGAARILAYLADTGDPRAQAALGTLIDSGAVAPDYPLPALELLQQAANQGLPEAALELGNRNYLGDGVPRDLGRAVEWWRIAAEKSSAAAAYNLGLAHAKGSGTPIDLAQAQTWFGRAAEQGSTAARFALALVQLEAAGTQSDLTAACENFKQAAAAGLAIAQYNLGSLYERGIGCGADLELAVSWYQKAAAADVVPARDALQRLGRSPGAQVIPAATSINAAPWVLAQNDNFYTLQVATGASERAIVKILEDYDEKFERAYFKVRHDDGFRFLALVGSFASYIDARAHLDALAPKLRLNKPWVRRFGAIQKLAFD